VKFYRLFDAEDGASRMQEIEAEVSPVALIPNQPSLDLSDVKDVKNLTFIRTPSGWQPSPRCQFVFGTSGVLEFQTTDGQTCTVIPGTVVLLEDTAGEGHILMSWATTIGGVF
jgi:hypothetical protein